MTTKSLLLTAMLAVATTAIAAPQAVSAGTRVVVSFQAPEKFTDVGDSSLSSDRARDGYLGVLKEHLEKQAPRYLAEGQALTVTFTDIDMAGDFEPWHGPTMMDVRVIKDIYPTRMKLSFRLTDAKGTVVKEGDRALIDRVFQMRSGLGRNSDSLFYEKAVLDDWLNDEFKTPGKAVAAH